MPDPEADYEIDFTPDERKILDGIRYEPPAPSYMPPREDREREILDAQQNAATDRELAGLQLKAAASAAREQGQEPAEGTVVTDENTVELLGKRFRIADKIGLMPLLKFSAASDMRTDDPKALSALYSMLQDCIVPDDWADFERHAIDTKAEADDLLNVIQEVMTKLAGRPTGQRDGSSPGARAISASSTARSSSRRGRGSKH